MTGSHAHQASSAEAGRAVDDAVNEKKRRYWRTGQNRLAAALPGLAQANLNQIYVFGLQALRTFLYLKGHPRTLIERTVPTGRNRGKMDENIFAIFALDKPKSFCSVKPLHDSCFFQKRLLLRSDP
jgi:hypothetical protein